MLKDYLEYYKISQTDFAKRLGITTKHMNEIINGNTNVSLELMHSISMLTDIDINFIFYVDNKQSVEDYLNKKYKTSKDKKDFLEKFHAFEMEKLGWIKLKDNTSNVDTAIDLLRFLNIRNFDILPSYLDHKFLCKNKKNADTLKIYLWIKHCDKCFLQQKVGNYNKNNLETILNGLRHLRTQTVDKKRIVELFNRNGIYLVIEDTLPNTKVKSAVTIKNSNPIIYLSKSINDKSTFYFTLYCAIRQIKSNYNMAKNKIIIDTKEDYKLDASTNFALNEMISDKVWIELKSNKNREAICKKNYIPQAFISLRQEYDKVN